MPKIFQRVSSRGIYQFALELERMGFPYSFIDGIITCESSTELCTLFEKGMEKEFFDIISEKIGGIEYLYSDVTIYKAVFFSETIVRVSFIIKVDEAVINKLKLKDMKFYEELKSMGILSNKKTVFSEKEKTFY